MPDDDYLEHLEEARELIQLAGETDEGRAAARRWLRQVISAVGDAEPVVLQPVPPELAGSGYIANRDAMRRSGYDATTVALSETGGAGIELYPDPRAGTGSSDPVIMLGQYDNGGPAADGGTTMQYDMAALHQAAVQDEVDRYSLMMDGRRPGPARPEYAGLQLSEPLPLEEADEQDIVQATMQLASRIGNGCSFRDVSEVAFSGGTGDRAAALVDLDQRFAPATPSPAAGALDLELARQREAEGVWRRHVSGQQGQELDARVADIVRRNPGMLADTPRHRGGQTHVSVSWEDGGYDKYADQPSTGQPAKGGVLHPEVERIAREHGLYFGGVNETCPVPSARERERQERRARAGHQGGLYDIPQWHRGATRMMAMPRG